MPRQSAETSRPKSNGRKQAPARTHGLDRRLKRIRLVLCDVDGVLTDGGVWMGREGETKRFNIRDGLGMKILQRSGIQIGWVSRRPSNATRERAEDLRIDFLVQSDSGKRVAVETILRQTGLNWDALCYVGDDIVDLCVLKRAGLAVAVADSTPEPKACAHYVTRAPGGHGAVREVIEMILKAQNRWDKIIAEYAD